MYLCIYTRLNTSAHIVFVRALKACNSCFSSLITKIGKVNKGMNPVNSTQQKSPIKTQFISSTRDMQEYFSEQGQRVFGLLTAARFIQIKQVAIQRGQPDNQPTISLTD
jgi:hypothetical protein